MNGWLMRKYFKLLQIDSYTTYMYANNNFLDASRLVIDLTKTQCRVLFCI